MQGQSGRWYAPHFPTAAHSLGSVFDYVIVALQFISSSLCTNKRTASSLMVAVQHLTSISVLLEGVCLCTFLSPESTCLLAIPSSSKFSLEITFLVTHVLFCNTPSIQGLILRVYFVMFYGSWTFRMSCVMGIRVLGNAHFNRRPAPSLSTSPHQPSCSLKTPVILPTQMCALLEPLVAGESFPLSQTGCTVYSQNSEMRECKNSN